MKKGDPLFQMDPKPWQDTVNSLKAQLAEAQEKYDVERRLVEKQAGVMEKMINLKSEVDKLKADLDKAQYNLDHTVIAAPSDGYVVNLVLRAGVFIRLKQPVVTFVDTEEYYLVAAIPQKASQWVRRGNEVEVALEMYPGKVFPGEIDDVVWASGRAQMTASGVLPTAQQVQPSELFVVKIRYKGDEATHPLRFGASGLAAIYTGEGPDVFKLLRQLEIRSESWLNYLYNPF
jgi:multidrug resistance efflux pump